MPRNTLIAVAACLLLLVASASASAAPAWRITSVANTTALPSATITYYLEVVNVGSSDANGEKVTTMITFPSGVTGVSGTGREPGFGPLPPCTATDGESPVTGQSTIQCVTTNPVPSHGEPGLRYTIVAQVDPAVATPSTLTTLFNVAGGGAPAAGSTVDPTRIDNPPAFGIDAFDGEIVADQAGDPMTQAGGHPYAISTAIDFNTVANPSPLLGDLWPAEPLKDALVDLPPGLVGSVTGVDECTVAQLAHSLGHTALPYCPPTSQIGTTLVRLNGFPQFPNTFGPISVYNLVPPPDAPAKFGFNIFGTVVTLTVRARSATDYGISVDGNHISEGLAVAGASFTFWGVPSDPSHDSDRACPGLGDPSGGVPSCPSGAPPRAFFRLPTSCSAPAGSPAQDGLMTKLSIDSWDHPGARDANGEPVAGDSNWVHSSYVSHAPPGYPLLEESWGPHYLPTGCDKVPFTPTLTVNPSSPARAGAPSGMTFEAKLPQSDDPSSVAEGDVEKTVVTLPRGLTVNPSAASGLGSCSEAQIGFTGVGTNEPNPVHFNTQDPSCPESSKIATAELETPLLPLPLKGAVFLAAQDENPFGSLLASYLVVQGQGVTIKLAGQVALDPGTGQLTATFDHTPQAPFSDLKLTFKEGPRALFILPPDCGTYTTGALLDSWSGASVSAPSNMILNEAEGGCGPHAFNPSFGSGTQSPDAGAYSPLVISFSRGDGEQQLSGLTETLAPGLSAKLAGVPLCSDSDANLGTCPASSQIGTVLAGSGAGPSPLFLHGRVYLTGPYNGGPFGEAVVVPAVAGPFNLGNVVVRGSIRVDPTTAQASVVSDPFPQFVGNTGIPTDVRRVDVTLDRPGFSFNPTSCEAQSITGALSSVQGASVPLSVRFQAHNCATLPFKPSFKVSTQANGSFNKNGASLDVKITTGQGPSAGGGVRAEANIRKVEVALPSVLPSRLTTLQKACTEKQFAANPAGCPHEANIGFATAVTPLLGSPLSGPAYLVSHGGQAFPDLVLILQGEGINLQVTGHTQIKKGVTYSRFETVPDAPISSFELKLPEGPFSALAATTPLCGKTVTARKRVTRRVHGQRVHGFRKVKRLQAARLLMPTTITGQNGAVLQQTTKITVTGCTPPKPTKKKPAKNRAATGRRR